MQVTRKEEKSNGAPGLKLEIFAVFVLGLAIFLTASLVSYRPEDPSFGHYNSGASKNLVGVVGSYVAGFLLDGMGISAFWLPFFCILFTLRLIRGASFRQLFYLILGCFSLLTASSSLVALFFSSGQASIFSSIFPTAGIVGTLLANSLTSVLNTFGACLFIMGMFLISLMGTFGFSIYVLVSGIHNRIKESGKLIRTSRKESRLSAKPEPHRPIPQIVEPVRESNAGTELESPPEEFPVSEPSQNFSLPSLNLLNLPVKEEREKNKEGLLDNARLLENKLADFGVHGKVTEICPGPVITMYEFEPASGVKINKITSLADDLALALKAGTIRIVVPIPGKSVIGIEIPNTYRESVYLREILESSVFAAAASKLTIALGKDIVGQPIVTNLARMPHLLIAGATGTGKSVFLNSVICSVLFKATPDEVRLLMIDPKRIELSAYDDIPHLLHPVVTEPKKATKALRWAVEEMERRYIVLEERKAKNIDGYNQNAESPLPYILVVIDELADLMLVSSHEVEEYITRLAQMARAAGIHLLIATQRPSVDVLTGVIKANFPTRVSFQVSSKIDSRTILDIGGAESLLGCGDMLFLPPGTAKLQRIHGAYVSENEITRVVDFLKAQKEPVYDEVVLSYDDGDEEEVEDAAQDEKYEEAVRLVLNTGQASISMVQRRLRVGYNRAARMIERMEREGLVGPADGSRPREILRKSN